MPITEQHIKNNVSKYSSYCHDIQSHLEDYINNPENESLPHISKSIINGKASIELQNLVPIKVRREAGIFFTNTKISQKVAKYMAPHLKSNSKIIDPACGAGNLLIECAKLIPKGDTLINTLENWSKKIVGYDIYPEFIQATRYRLMILALMQHPYETNSLKKIKFDRFFKDIKAYNILSGKLPEDDASIVVNPPFGHMTAPPDCRWSKGKIQTAGWFFERILKLATNNQQFIAILPDVLRSGSRYEKWRKSISEITKDLKIDIIGRFDPYTDVDVFILRGAISHKKSQNTRFPLNLKNKYKHKISDYFDVHVGTVVPHRDPRKGKIYPYIHARSVDPWQTINRIHEEIQTTNTVFKPPFVVVRRTSSPNDKYRCKASIINVKNDVAVENHLIVITPRNASVENCKSLIEELKLPNTNEWLNNRIRCRHLTVSSIKDIPLNIFIK